MALNFPTDTTSPYVDPTTGLKYVYNAAVGAWESALQPPVIVSATTPQTAIEGFLWFNSADNTLYVYRSGAWNAVSTSTPSGSAVNVSSSSPATPSGGDLWWDSVLGQLFIYYTDPDGGNAWLPASPSLTALAGSVYVNSSSPSLPEVGDMWLRDYDNLFRIWNGSTWVQPLNEVTGVNSVTGTTPINVDNTDSANPIVSIAQATNSSVGSIRIATQAETNAGSDTSVALTPGTLTNGIANYLPATSTTVSGTIELATQAEVDAGSDTTRAVTPATLSGAASILGLATPVGVVSAYAGTLAPPAYLFCNGSAVSRTTYSALFAVIGTTYGGGDGSTTFNLPDLRGEFIRGLDSGRGIDSGRTLGSFQADELKQHSHDFVTGVTGDADAGGGDRDNDAGLASTNNFGGSETRPRNVALNYIIKF